MRYGLFATTLFAALCAFSSTEPAVAQPAAKAEPKGPPICANCHEQPHASTVMSAHGAKNDAQGSMCQACHGDATEHLKDPVKSKPANLIKTGTAAEKTDVCLTCHKTGRQLAFWESGKHALNDVPCSSCHSIHGKDRNPSIAPFTTSFRPNESEICGTCHQDIRSQTLKPSHHPIMEGKVKCSDCHNPHGSSHYKLLREHTPNLCQDCHDAARHPGTIYGGGAAWLKPDGTPNPSVNTRFIARACLNCHNAVHGSNAPGNKGKFFLR